MAGFTKLQYLGHRKNDRSEMGYIELVNNPIAIQEKADNEAEKKSKEFPTFWEWEKKVLS
jgi:hypothetical protein